MKRVGLFICINFAVLMTIGFVVKVLGLNTWLTAQGIDYSQLFGFSIAFGFVGSFMSLLLSKSIAKMSVGARVIKSPENEKEAWLVQTVEELTSKANLALPEVAIYEGSANAFATGAFKNDALVAVSTGLLQSMTRPEIKAVLAHEVSHIKNGDMITMALIQGVLNTFVFFFARVVATFISSSRDEDGNRRQSRGIGYYFTVQIFEMIFGILASIIACAFSRRREYKADKGASELLGSSKDMIKALQALGRTDVEPLPSEMKAFGITGLPSSFLEIFSTHPPLSSRIKALSSEEITLETPLENQKRASSGGVFSAVSSEEKTPWG